MTRSAQRRTRRRAALTARLAAATSPSARIAAAADYARAAIGDLPPASADVAATEVVRALTNAVDQLTRDERRH